jgi:CRP-like cAMP-binding protein
VLVTSERPRLTPGTVVTRRLNAFAPLGPDDFTLFASLKGRTVPAGTVLGEADPAAFLLSGWAARVSVWPAEQPQILSLLLPGDGFGLWAAPWAGEAMPVAMLTEAVLIDASSIRALIETRSIRHAAITEACRLASLAEQGHILDHVVRLGRCSADARVAHLACDLFQRLDLIGLVSRRQFHLPLRQQILADALGLSGVHFNRITRKLKQDGLADFSRGAVRIPDPARLMALACAGECAAIK